MSMVMLEIPDDSLLALKVAPEQAGQELCLVAAVKLFELGKLSSGAAARLAGVPRVVFLTRLADYGVDTFRLSEEELEREEVLGGVVHERGAVFGIPPERREERSRILERLIELFEGHDAKKEIRRLKAQDEGF